MIPLFLKQESLFLLYIDQEIDNLINKKIKIKVLGNIYPFPNYLKSKIIKVQKLTKNNLSLIHI